MFQVIARTNELLENSNEQRRKQEKILEEKQEQINKMEANMKSVTADVIKVQLMGHGWSWFLFKKAHYFLNAMITVMKILH